MGVVHLTVFWCADIHAASLGDDQFSFGATSPPSSLIVSLMVWCISGKRWSGGSRGELASASSSSSESTSGSSGVCREYAVDVGSQSSSSSPPVDGSSLDRMIPSSRMYSIKSGDNLIMRDLIHDVLYLNYMLALNDDEITFISLTLETNNRMSNEEYGLSSLEEKRCLSLQQQCCPWDAARGFRKQAS